MQERGLLAEVFRWSLPDCTNGGISSRHNTLLIALGSGPFGSSERNPPLYLAEWCDDLILVPEPINTKNGLNGWMFGGNFLYSSDSRFPSKHPIKIFDRRE